MNNDFAKILRGLMENRNLTPRAVSRASARAESTINQLLSGKVSPRTDLLRDIAPVLQMEVSDLLVIADLPVDSPSEGGGDLVVREIGELVAIVSFLKPEQIRSLVEIARQLRSGSRDR